MTSAFLLFPTVCCELEASLKKSLRQETKVGDLDFDLSLSTDGNLLQCKSCNKPDLMFLFVLFSLLIETCINYLIGRLSF